MPADKLKYDSTGAGEFVKSDASEIMGGWSVHGGIGETLPPEGMGRDTGGVSTGPNENSGSGPMPVQPAAGGSPGGWARPGGHQDAEGDSV